MGGAVSNEASVKIWKIKDSLPVTKPRPRVYPREHLQDPNVRSSLGFHWQFIIKCGGHSSFVTYSTRHLTAQGIFSIP